MKKVPTVNNISIAITVTQVMTELEKKGSAQTRKTYANHGAPQTMYGVKVGDLKPIAKKLKGQQDLALQLFDTGNCDAMYLAGLVADGAKMSKKRLEQWAKQAKWHMISEYIVPWVATESGHGRELAMKWMKSKTESTAACGWATYSCILGATDDSDLDLAEIKSLLKLIPTTIGKAPNRVRYTMNGFVIATGSFVKPLLKNSQDAAKKIGKVEVDMGGTACKVPSATQTIEKMIASDRIGKKRNNVKC